MLLADNDHRITAPRVMLNGSSLNLEVFNICSSVCYSLIFLKLFLCLSNIPSTWLCHEKYRSH